MQSNSDDRAAVGQQGGALEGLRVLDIATFVAAPFCGTILADFGADVIKIEQPRVGDSLRKFGTITECGDSLVWLSESRNKKTVTLDLRKEKGVELFKKLVAESDVVLENFRPGTLEKWGIGFEDLKKVNPGLVMLRISAYGQTGPRREYPGFARIAHAFGGLAELAGEADGPPVVPGSTSLADYVSGMWGAIGVLMALRSRDTTKEGQFIDLGLYESVFRLLDELAPAYAKYGTVRGRMGADTVNVVPHSHYQTADGKWVALACTSDKMFQRLTEVMEQPDLYLKYPTSEQRANNRGTVNALVADWIGQRSLKEVLDLTESGSVPCAHIYTVREIFEDPQYKARGNLLHVTDERAGKLVLPASVPRLSKTPARFNHAGRSLGENNFDVFGQLLGLSAEELKGLSEQGIL